MMIVKAIQFAATKHKGQERKVSGLPYITHPLIVMYLLQKYKNSKRLEELMTAAILHDTLEDTDTNFIEIAKEFTPMVAGLVLELTSDSNEIARVGKNEYLKIKMVGMSSYALVLKLVDRLANILDTPTRKYAADTIALMEHLVDSRILSGTQTKIVDDILEKCNEIL